MASGHASRINRPNTWLLRPDLRRAESPCQRGAVHTWHIASRARVATTFCIDSRHVSRVARDPIRKENVIELILPIPA
jgi:hypothetical protein